MTQDQIIKKLPPKDLLITRLDDELASPQEIKRPGCCPVDPKDEPKQGQAYENYVKGIAYTA